MKELIEINGKYYKKKRVPTWAVRISPEMKVTMPKVEKVKTKYSYYKKFGKFDSPVKVNKNYILVDGYITYLLAKMFGVSRIDVLMEL